MKRSARKPRSISARKSINPATAAARKRKPRAAANPLPIGRWIKGAVKLVKKGRKTIVQFAK